MGSRDNLVVNMRRLRIRAGMTQQELGNKMGGWNRQQVSAAETRGPKGRHWVLDEVDRLANALGVTATALIATPAQCPVCGDAPPPGMTCRICGADGQQ